MKQALKIAITLPIMIIGAGIYLFCVLMSWLQPKKKLG
jgi:hypothetical protein